MKKNIDLSLIDSLPPGILTFEAEEWGRTYPISQALPTLYTLLKHPTAIVREGAVLGLGHLAERTMDPEIWRAIEGVSNIDPSLGVRSTAVDLLNGSGLAD